MNTDTSNIYTEILKRLGDVQKKEHRLAIVHGIMAVVLIAVVLLLFIAILEGIFSFGTLGRKLLFVLAIVVTTGSIGWFIVRPFLYAMGILKSADNYIIALKVGKHFPDIRDRLLNALEMYENKIKLQQHYSLPLIDASFNDLYEQIQPLNFLDAVDNLKIRRIRKFTTYAFSIFLLAIIISPSDFFGSLYRIANFNKSFAATPTVQIFIEPGNVEVVRGETVPIVVRTYGKQLKNLSLFTRMYGQIDFDMQKLDLNNEGTFKTEISNIKSTTEYFASSEDIKSDKFTIKVLDRPLIRSFQIKIVPPSYTRMPTKLVDENNGDISAYLGSKAELQLISSKELSFASMVFNDSMNNQLTILNNEAKGFFTIRKNVTYHFLLKDNDGLTNIDPVEYSIKIIPDEYPSVEILAPGKNIDIAEQMKLDLFIRLKDDFGFSSLRLAHRLVQSKYEQPAEEFSFIDIPLTEKNRGQIDIWHHWDISLLRLVPEDAVAYYVEVFDNDNVSGPKSSRSEIYIVRLPSLEEVFSDVTESHQQSMESMQQIAKETQQLKEDLDEFQREMKKNRDKMDWQQQKKVEEMRQRYDAMKKRLDEVSNKMEEMINKMEENKLLSDETLEKYLELQKLMEKLNSPELREAFKKLQESMKQLSPEQMKQAMEQLKFNEEQFRQSLERTIELLKRIHIEQKLDELIKRTEELIKQQEELSKETAEAAQSDSKKREELMKKQNDLQKKVESLEKETADLKQKMEEFPKEMPLNEMAQAEQQLQESQPKKKMQNSMMQMQAGNMQGAQKNQSDAQKDLSDFSDKLKQAQKAMLDKQMKQIVNQMRKQLENILELSKEEESLKEDTRSIDPNSQRFRESIQKQNEIMQALSDVATALSEIGKKTFAISPEMGKEIGKAMQQMKESMNQMEMRNPAGSSEKQNEAMGSLNRAAMSVQSACNNMMQGQQCGMGMSGLMGRLSQMAGEQGQINQQTQQAMGMGQGQGNKFSAQQQSEYQRIGGQQGAMQKSLEQLAQEAKNTGEYSRMLGDLDRIAQEMQEVQTDLQQGNVNPNTLQKQERILSRLLESTRSMRERDYEKRRKADAGKNIFRTSPADIDLSTQEGKSKLREELLKVLEGKYTKDYEELIKKYFEQLEKEEIKQY
ncbi:MAG: hypothetical protein QME52_07875 [Bacteroidota bacterium]|nr:hypothetical protein [Bacteroidota bacterium]